MTLASPYEKALAESAIGHVVFIALAGLILAVSQCARPAAPMQDVIEVALFSGPPSVGGFGAPPPDAVPEQPPAPAPAPAPPAPPPVAEPQIKEPPPVRIEEPPKQVVPEPEAIKEPPKDKPVVREPPPPEPEKPKKHEVNVSKKIVQVAAPKNATVKPPANKKAGTPLTADEVKKLMGLNLPPSQNGGVGLRGDPRNTGVERGREGSAMELYKAALKARLYNAWQRPAGVEGLRTVIRLSIARDGTFISATLLRSSGHEQMDSSALQAVRAVRPVPLPAGADAPYPLEVEFDASGVSV